MGGFEPPTYCLGGNRSIQTELHGLYLLAKNFLIFKKCLGLLEPIYLKQNKIGNYGNAKVLIEVKELLKKTIYNTQWI